MNVTKFSLFICFFIGGFHIIQAAKSKKLIVVLIDGCRWDYLDDPNLKGISRMIKSGVRASAVYPIYPSMSYPNWYTLVTGLYAENHGFVNNEMYNPGTGDFFFPNTTNHASMPDYWWTQAEPIWITAEKAGMNTALYWWAGCEIAMDRIHPYICERHRYGPGNEDDKNDFLLRIDDLVGLFKPSRVKVSTMGETSGVSLALMYYGPVDFNGHHFGPDAPETRKAFYAIDDILDQMQTKLEEAGLKNEVNIMVVSDHGMLALKEDTNKSIDIEKYSHYIKYQVTTGASSMIVPEDGMLDVVVNEMTQDKIVGMKIYKKDDIPEEFHLKGNGRVPPLFLQAEESYYIKALQDGNKWIGEPQSLYKGTHGYDPSTVSDMKTIFVATGPDFQNGFNVSELYNTDFYNVMCSILDLQALPNNGSWERIKSVLVEGDSGTQPNIQPIQPKGSGGVLRFSYIISLAITFICIHLSCVFFV